MNFNKKSSVVNNSQKLLRKIKGQWVTITVALLLMLGIGVVSASANEATPNNQAKITNVALPQSSDNSFEEETDTLLNELESTPSSSSVSDNSQNSSASESSSNNDQQSQSDNSFEEETDALLNELEGTPSSSSVSDNSQNSSASESSSNNDQQSQSDNSFEEETDALLNELEGTSSSSLASNNNINNANTNQISNEYQSLPDDNSDVYDIQPSTNGYFNEGQLNPNYINEVVNWVNFFRNIYGLQPVTDDASLNDLSQYGAADMAATHDLDHGLTGATKPDYISQNDWDQGVQATDQSNISSGDNNNLPYDIVEDFVNDPGNPITGHRGWIFDNNLSKIGVGLADGYSDVDVVNDGNQYENGSGVNLNNALPYPKAGYYPYQEANNCTWSLYLPDYYDTDNISVSVYDNTADQNVPVSNLHNFSSADEDYGDYATSINYDVDDSMIKPDHTYTINVDGLDQYGQESNYSYTTTLFNAGAPQNSSDSYYANQFSSVD